MGRMPVRGRWPGRDPPPTSKKPSSVRAPVQNGRSAGSMSLVSRLAELASVRATIEDRHPADVGGQPGRGQRPDVLGGGHQDLAAHVPALLLRGKLVLEVHTGGPGLDERLGQLEDVERSTEPGLAVGDDGNHPVDGVVALGPVDLVGAAQGVDDPPHQGRGGVGRVEALVGVDLVGQVGVARHLPAGEVDRLEPGLDHLHRLASAHGAERVDVVAGGEQLPQLLRHQIG